MGSIDGTIDNLLLAFGLNEEERLLISFYSDLWNKHNLLLVLGLDELTRDRDRFLSEWQQSLRDDQTSSRSPTHEQTKVSSLKSFQDLNVRLAIKT